VIRTDDIQPLSVEQRHRHGCRRRAQQYRYRHIGGRVPSIAAAWSADMVSLKAMIDESRTPVTAQAIADIFAAAPKLSRLCSVRGFPNSICDSWRRLEEGRPMRRYALRDASGIGSGFLPAARPFGHGGGYRFSSNFYDIERHLRDLPERSALEIVHSALAVAKSGVFERIFKRCE